MSILLLVSIGKRTSNSFYLECSAICDPYSQTDKVSCQGEDEIRESGIPYTIVRPCALTEEPAGADLIFDQGDNITVFAQKL